MSSSTSRYHVPGAYHFDPPLPPPSSAPSLSAGLFRPPISPSASSSAVNLTKSTCSLLSDSSTAPTATNLGRKRAHADSARASTPLAEWTHMSLDAPTSPPARPDMLETSTYELGRPTRYVLAGQIETPGGFVKNPLEESIYSDVDYRRGLGPQGSHETAESVDQLGNLSASNMHSAHNPISEGWNVFSTIGGVVGKVWDFCKGGGFRGFYAGGGKGFAFDSAGVALTPNRSHNTSTDLATSTFSPTELPQSDYMPYMADCHETSTPDTTPRPTAKRRQVSGGVNTELRRNWVMVEEPVKSSPAIKPQQQRSQQQQPSKPSSRATSTGRPSSRLQSRPALQNRRISTPVPRLSAATSIHNNSNPHCRPKMSHAGSPVLISREPASFAAPRGSLSPSRPPPPPHSPSKIPLPSTNPFARSASPRPGSSRPGSRHSAVVPSQQQPRRRSGSNASTASTAAARRRASVFDHRSEILHDNSPRLDAEAKKLAARKLAADRDADARMESFNSLLQDMIRQGKEALGTKIEVESMEMEDGRDGAWLDD